MFVSENSFYRFIDIWTDILGAFGAGRLSYGKYL